METLIDDPPATQDGEDADLCLKNLSDFKELCKSVASLLHIEDKAAAAMLTEPLSGRRDLVEGLDAEAILDYLTQHGVLDAETVQSLRSTSCMTQRNASLLQRVEEEGHNAVALFINALRQSGQLHLASSLDNTQRIKPMSGSGYWEKQRHKGQVTIQIKVNKLLIVVPERDTHGDVIDASMLASPHRHGLDLDQHHHQSYENMQLLESPDLAMQQSVRIYDYPYCVDDEEERPVGKKSFFCFCFPRAAKKKKAKEKKYLEQQELKLKRSFQPNPRDNEEVSRDISGMKVDKNKRVRSPEKDSPARISSSQGETGEVTLGGDYRRNNGGPRKDFNVDLVDQKNTKNERKSHSGSGSKLEDKENTDPVIMEYNKKMELVKLRAQTHKDKADGKGESSSPVIMCEKWKSGGRYFQKKLQAFCELFEFELHTYIIKYFEQDRGTLVLQVWTDGSAMYIYNICLTVEQVRQLQNDFSSGVLAKRLDTLLRSNGSLEKLDIKDADWGVTIDDDQFRQAHQDLA